MGRYRGPSCKICRRNGTKLYLKGTRCETAKCAIEKRNFPPGPKAAGFGKKLSEYGRRLREKQKLRFFYGVSEKAIRAYFQKASRQKGITGHLLLSLFEHRLDNVVFRAGLADSRKDARQLVRHGHFLLNGKKANIPSMMVHTSNELSIKASSMSSFEPIIKKLGEHAFPEWISYDEPNKVFKIAGSPTRDQIDAPVEEQLIVEFYSR
jgi:small subunit ribosomal protein S4